MAEAQQLDPWRLSYLQLKSMSAMLIEIHHKIVHSSEGGREGGPRSDGIRPRAHAEAESLDLNLRSQDRREPVSVDVENLDPNSPSQNHQAPEVAVPSVNPRDRSPRLEFQRHSERSSAFTSGNRDFCEAGYVRFGDRQGVEVVEDFNKLLQIDDVETYTEKFEKLRASMLAFNPSLSEAYFVTSYISGLKQEIKNLVKLRRPKSLAAAYEQARLQFDAVQAIIKAPRMRILSSIETLQEANRALDYVVDGDCKEEIVEEPVPYTENLDSNRGIQDRGAQIEQESNNPSILTEKTEDQEKIEDTQQVFDGMPAKKLVKNSDMEVALCASNIHKEVVNSSISDQENGEQSSHWYACLRRGIEFFSEQEFGLMDRLCFTENMVYAVAYNGMDVSFDPTGIGWNNFRTISVRSLEALGAQYMFEEMPIRSSNTKHSSIHIGSVFNPDIFDATVGNSFKVLDGQLEKEIAWVRIPVTLKECTKLVLESEIDDFVDLWSILRDSCGTIETSSSFIFDPGGVVAWLATVLALKSSGIGDITVAKGVKQRLQWDPGGSCLLLLGIPPY